MEIKPLAQQLNKTLMDTSVYGMLSDYGRRMFVPKGIIVQSAEAKKKATRFNATIGVALENHTVMYMPEMMAQFAPSMKPGEIFSYAPMGGVAALRDRWAQDMVKKNPLLEGKKFSSPVVVSGLTNALSIVASLFLDEGDAVVLPNMYWENYDLILEQQRKAKPVLFDNFDGEGFNVAGLDKALSSVSGKAVVLLNFPNNPTGYTPTNAESQAIAQVLTKQAQNKKIVVISDDAYFGLFFSDDVCRQSLFARLCDASENLLAIKCDGATKEEMVWGFRTAFITYGFKGCTDAQLDALVQKTMGCIRGSLSNCNMAAQNILLKAMDSPDHDAHKKAGVDKICRRYVLMKQALARHAGESCLKPYPFNSGYFMSFWTACPAEDLRQKLLNDYGTGTICLGEHLLRLAFSSIDECDINDLVDTVYKAASELC